MAETAPERALVEQILFDGPLVRIGAFRAHPRHPCFHNSGTIERHIFVFPRTSVWIQHEGEAPFVADPNIVTFYNRGQAYTRDRIAEDGDRCEWFSVAPEAVLEAVCQFQPEADERPERPFSVSHGPGDSRAYLRQRRLVQDIHWARHDPLCVEETVLELLDAVLEASFCARGASRRRVPAIQRRHRDLAEAAKAILGATFRENLRLPELSAALGVTPGHLCRVFRGVTGTTLHHYRDQLRLRTALEALAEPQADLTELALELGYSSHSHFSHRFRRAFATRPSAFRTEAANTC